MPEPNPSAPIKNPLAVAFGKALQQQRKRLGNKASVAAVSKTLDVGPAYYRLFESGSANLHVSRALNLVRAFKNTIHLQATVSLLGALSVMESAARRTEALPVSAEEYYAAAVELADLDEKLKRLFESVFDQEKRAFQHSGNSLKKGAAVSEVLSFLTEHPTYGQDSSSISNSYLNSFFEEIPSIYFETINNVKKSLVALPVRIGFNTLWQWESRNQQNFKSAISLTANIESVISIENLTRYRYPYLWLDNFESCRFLFISDQDARELKYRFCSFLRTVVHSQEIDNQSLLKSFDAAMSKVEVKTLRSDLPILRNLLSGPDYSHSEADKSDQRSISPKHYNAVWAFTMSEGWPVGFLADISSTSHNGEINKITEGISLSSSDTLRRLQMIHSLWNDID